ncbi:MAG TPA: SGNH/GDSL hydrolase family protein, partial [Flavobacteriales bacterium]|nr:SGNH/GDSL hydrolase family protein [Flavobacteriales bacterium]
MKKIIILALVLSIAVGIILMAVEFGSRDKENNIELRQHAPNISKNAVTPFKRLLREGDRLEEYVLRTDANGFILPSKIHDEPDIDIYFVGGSTTECETVKEILRFPYLVGRLLEEKTGLKVNAFNAGVGGNNSQHSLNILIHKILPLQPDIVVYHHNINDIVQLAYYGNYNAGVSNEEGDDKFSKLRGSTVRLDTKSIALQYKNALEGFVDACLSKGAQPVLMTQILRTSLDQTPNRLPESLELTIPQNPFDSVPEPAFLKVIHMIHKEFNSIIRDEASEHDLLL